MVKKRLVEIWVVRITGSRMHVERGGDAFLVARKLGRR